MKRLQPVIWMKGTFLNAQYLQSQDRFFDNILQFNLEALSSYPWGFSELRLDQEALAAGNIALSRASGIFPDGLIFDIPDADPAPPTRPIAEYFEPDQNQVDVYLSIPSYREKGWNVSLANRQADTRYVADVIMLRDENSGLSEKPVQIARKNFRFLFEGENLKGYSSLRVARVRRTTAGSFQFDARFQPPLLNIKTSDYLMSIARRLVEILSAKSSILSGQRRQKNLSLADFPTSDIANFWLLYTINSHFPQLQHIYETKRGHPEGLFQVMLSLAGCLTTFSTKIHPRDLPKYNHDDLEPAFTDLDEKVRELLETVVPSNYVSLPLKLVSPHIYATALADDKYFRDTRLYLAISSEMDQGELIAKAPQLIKVCSANHIEHLVRQALPGVVMTHTPRPPAAIPMKLNHEYFSLNLSGVYWEAVLRARNLAAYVPGDFPNPQLELIVLLPE
ncbi:MAG: type VI secretion system baseplate subunit TssK [Bryobacteraceae bacterium]|nr:type VI secretion system baseplate subunit TssK [Bryobacteraceae bacterium]MDW8379844.1 type VI secretion system baseplate subunit TssK [Bryobacterales bacterium]